MMLNTHELRKQLAPLLGPQFFAPNPKRVSFLVVAYAVSGLHLLLTQRCLAGDVHQFVWVCSLLVTANVTTFFFFFMHEVLHGSVLKSRRAISLTAFLGGIPFLCSPYVWRVWHNHHHRHTGTPEDTDRQPHPHLDDFASPLTRIHDFGKRLSYLRPFAYVVPFIVISGHHLLMLMQTLFGTGPLKMNRRRAVMETACVYTLFFLPIYFLGWATSLLGIYLPLMFGHIICNFYILSNHFNNPLGDENYPLINSTSVYLHSRLPLTHMGFGRHVEHHIFPYVTHDKLSKVSQLLRDRYPDQYQERQLLAVVHAVFLRAGAREYVSADRT